MRIAVTGSCGHLGANMVRALLDAGHDVRALYRTRKNLVALEGLEVDKIEIDVLQPETLIKGFQGADAVVHLAAIISIDGDKDGRAMQTNVVGPRHVAHACIEAKIKKLIHVSSIHAFKIRRHDSIVDENQPPADATCFKYDQSKALGEREILRVLDKGLDATILNPTGILGPQDFGPSRAGQMLRDMFSCGMPFLVNGGFDWVDARDVAQAAISALQTGKRGERYILSGHFARFDELSRVCNAISGRTTQRKTLPIWMARAGLPFARLADYILDRQPLFTSESLHIIEHASENISSAKAERDLDFAPRALEETLADTYAWWRSQGLA